MTRRILLLMTVIALLALTPATPAHAGWTRDGWEVKGTNFTPLTAKTFRIKNTRDERVVYKVKTTAKNGWWEKGTYRVPPHTTLVFHSWFRGKHRAVNSWWIDTVCTRGCKD